MKGAKEKMNRKELLENIPELVILSKLYSNIDVTIFGTDSSPFLTKVDGQGLTGFSLFGRIYKLSC